MTDWIGRTLGRVHIERLIARGGMAEVYLGTHTTLQRKVAVKILRNYYTDDRLRPLERFELEARAVAKLRHPNIVQVFDFDTVEDQPYLVMELIPGPPLSKYLAQLHAKGDRLGLPLISRLLTRIADALQYAHEHGVIHRDVKPGNILLTSRSIQIIPGETLPLDLEPVLTDFGLVRFLNTSRQTISGLITGTPAYMSPEQAMGHATDGRTDIYSLGIVLYEMLSGRVPFEAESTMSVLLQHLHDPPPPIPGLSPALQEVLDRALAKDPNDRFQEPKEFAAAFDNALENTSQANTLVTIPQVLKVAKASQPTPMKRPTHIGWRPVALGTALILLTSVSLLLSGKFATSNAEAPTTIPIAISDTPVLEIPVTFGPTANLHFQDGAAVLDRATLVAQALPAPPADSQYEVWLSDGQERFPLGALSIDESGKGELTFDDPQKRNLLAFFKEVEITVEPKTNPDPKGSTDIAYISALPDAGLVFLRKLMVSFPTAPEQVGLLQGLMSNTELIEKASQNLLSDYRSGDQTGTRKSAEAILNMLVGAQSPDHKDWDGDGKITDPGDGYGLFLNGSNLGYIRAVYSHADYAVNSPGASRNMIVNGENVKVCTQNLAQWVPELRSNMLAILNAATLSGLDSAVQRSVDLADQMLNGIDANENGTIEAVSAECGTLGAYHYAYLMADLPLLPFDLLGTAVGITETATPSQTATSLSPFIITATKQQNGSSGTVATVAPANQPPAPANNNNNNAKPTKKPKNEPPAQPPGQGSGQDSKPTKSKP